MTESIVTSGLRTHWSVEHHDGNGNLISRQAVVQPPAPIACIKPNCLWRYMRKSLQYTLTMLYHKYRATYAEDHRHQAIPMKYRTGEDAPVSMIGLIYAILKLKIGGKYGTHN